MCLVQALKAMAKATPPAARVVILRHSTATRGHGNTAALLVSLSHRVPDILPLTTVMTLGWWNNKRVHCLMHVSATLDAHHVLHLA